MMTKHADASPSASSIWINCPGSVTLARGRQRRATSYTREGSAAHEVADRLLYGIPVPDEIEIEGEVVEIDENMVGHVQVYVDHVHKLRQGRECRTEARVHLKHLPEPISGTADFLAWDPDRLDVVDLKYGKGVMVTGVGNPQLRIYALGALDELGIEPKDVCLTVVQPRGDGAVPATETLPVEELWQWRDAVLAPALERIAGNDPTEIPGSHCRWCVRAGECRALASKAVDMAKDAFNDAPQMKMEVQRLSNADLADILDNEGQIRSWLDWVRLEATTRVDAGQEIPRYKLVPKRAMRKWIDEVVVHGILGKLLPVTDFTKVVSPAAVERALKAAKVKLPAVLADQITRQSSGTTLVREEDGREGLKTDAKSVFNSQSSLRAALDASLNDDGTV